MHDSPPISTKVSVLRVGLNTSTSAIGDLEKIRGTVGWVRAGVSTETTATTYSDGQPGNFKIYKAYHDRLRRVGGWYCFVVYWSHGRSGLTIVKDQMCKASSLLLLRWHGGGNHRGTQQAKIGISEVL